MHKAFWGIVVAAILISIMHFGLVYTNQLAGISWPIRKMTKDITAMPNKMGDWTVTEAGEIDSRVFAKLDATTAEKRIYEDKKGHAIHYHGSVFENFLRDVPHSPLVCYPAQGWVLLNAERTDIDLPDGTTFHGTLATFEQDNRKLLVLFWFQFGDFTVVNGKEMREAHEHYRPEEKWPSVAKILLQINGGHDFQNVDTLRDLASHVYTYTRTLQDGKAPKVKKKPPQSPSEPVK